MTYVVKKGDNLTKIAKQNGLTLKQLLSLNKNIENPDYIQIGQKINLETKSPTGKSAYDNNDGYPTTPVKKNTPTWDRITKGAGNPATVANFNKTPEKKAPIKKQVTQKEEPGFLDSMKNKIYETYQDVTTAIDQQTSKKVVAKPKVKIDDSFIDYGYKELGTYKDQSFKAGKNDSLLSAMNVFDNDKGFDYIVSPKVKEGKKTFNNVKGVAHFLMDTDITPNQKYTTPYIEKGNNTVKSAQAGKFTPYLGTNPDDYVMYYKNTGNDKMNVKYGQLKDKDKYKGYEQIKVRSIPFGELDFNNKKSAGFAKKASYIGTLDGKQTSIITDPESNDVYGRFSGGSGIFYFKEPKTGKTISVDVSGSVNTIKQVGEELSKKYNVDPKQLQFLYHDMGSYSAKPKSHNGVLSNEQWKNYNTNNKGYSGAALMYPMEYGGQVVMENGGMAASDNVDMGYYSNPLKYFAAMGINISDDDCLECGGKVYANNGLNIDSTLNANKNLNWVDRLYQKNTPTIFLPGESHPSTHYMENADNFVYPTIIQNEDGKLEYLGNKAYDYAMKTNTAIKFKTPEEAEYFAKNYKKGKGVLKKFNMGGKIKAEDGLNPKPLIPPKPEQIDFERERQLPPDASYERDVRKFSWNNRDTAPEQIKLDSSYMLYKPPKGYSNVYNKGKLIGYTVDNKILIPGEPNFQNGGMIKAWVQQMMKGGYAETGINIYGDQELTQPTTNYNQFMTMDQLNQKPFENPYQNMNLQQSSSPQFNIPQGQEMQPLQSIGMQKLSPNMQNTQNSINRSMKDMSPDQKSPVNMNAVNMGLDIGTQSMDAAANLMGSFGKDNSKSKAFGQGANNAMNVAGQVTAPFKDIPIAGKAIDAVGKTLGFFIGGALNARRQGIENEEMDKYNKLQEYTSRNAPAALAPSFYGQTMAKYGSNPKMMEQRIIDDIYTDFDKYMKLT